MRYWQCVRNPRVILSFESEVDNRTMVSHPEYIEVKKDGTPLSKVAPSDVRPDWQIPFHPTKKERN